MTHELILTSVSQGLEPDSQGFCIVGEDRDISPALSKRLTTLSHYRRLDLEDDLATPVSYSHLIVPGLDASWHILSRIVDTGTDYRHQPNHLAHHIAFKDSEQVDEGPAWLLALPGFHLSEWITPAVRFQTGKTIPTLTAPPPLTRRQQIARERHWLDPRKTALYPSELDEQAEEYLRAVAENEEQIAIARPPSSPCPTWRDATGDAGWGGVLAETIRTGQTAAILFPPGLNPLPLFVEALSLLPKELRWKGTFSTYFIGLPEHVVCQWKAVPADSPEADRLREDRETLLIDLCSSIGTASAGPYVEFARTGRDNLLPTDENPSDFFKSLAELDTKPYDPEEIQSGIDKSLTSSTIIPYDLQPPEERSALDPPVLPEGKFQVRIKTTPETRGPLDSILTMKSRGQFYLLYGATLLLVLILLVLLVDQFAGLGLIRWLRGESSSVIVADPAHPDIPAKQDDRPEVNAVQEEQKRREREHLEQLEIAKKRRETLLTAAHNEREAIRRKRMQDILKLDQLLLENNLPRFLAMPVPTVENRHVSPPPPKMFPQLSSFYPLGLALSLEFVPVADFPKMKVETRKLEFFLDDRPSATSTGKQSTDDPIAREDGTTNLDALNASTADRQQASVIDLTDPELRILDARRFEWAVLGIDTDTGRETPLFDLKLTEEGLEITWKIEGLTQQYLYDTLWASFAFLRVAVEGETDSSKIRSIPLFEPRLDKPVLPSEEIKNAVEGRYSVDMPFVAEPWKSLFEADDIRLNLRLDVTISPETPAGVQKIEIPERESPSRLFINFHTDIESRKAVLGGSDTYSPVVVAYEVAVDPNRLTCVERYDDQVKHWREELENGRAELETKRQEEEEVRQAIFNAGTAATTEQRNKRNELNAQNRELVNRNREIEDILAKLPSARDKVLASQELRFDYRVSLVPVPPVAADRNNDNAASNRLLASERSLLILTTRAPTEKAPAEEKTGASPAETTEPESDTEDTDDSMDQDFGEEE